MKSSVPEYIPPGRGVSSWITSSPHRQEQHYKEIHHGWNDSQNAFHYDLHRASIMNRREKPKAELLIQPQKQSESLYQTDIRRNHYSTNSERVGLKLHVNSQDNLTTSNPTPAVVTPTFSEISQLNDSDFHGPQQYVFHSSSRDDHSVGGNSTMSASRKLLKQSARKDHQNHKKSASKVRKQNTEWQTSISPHDEMGFPRSSIVNATEKSTSIPRMRPRSTYQIAQESMELLSYPIEKRNESSHLLNAKPPRPKSTNKFHDSHETKKNERNMKKNSSSPLEKTQTSHDEMSPLVHQGKSLIPNTSMDKNRRISSFAHGRSSENSMDVTYSSTAAICDEKYDMNDKESKNKTQYNAHHQEQTNIITPIKTGRGKKSVRFDQSWDQSPIAPGGSFCIFHDSMEKMSPLKPLTNDGLQKVDFMKVVAAIVIQTFFRRHLAYKSTCRRYRAVLLIQQYCHQYLRKKKDVSMELRHCRHRLYDVAAMQIQAAWRGFWVRDCILVDNYCATLIQKLYRGHLARWCYGYDLCRITIAQSVVRRFLVQSSIRKNRAATLIQARWRGYVGVKQFICQLADILIVQSVCRRWLVNQATKQNNQRKNKGINNKQSAIIPKYNSSTRSTRMIKTDSDSAKICSNLEQSLIDVPVIMKVTGDWNQIAPNVISPSESVRSRSEELAQLDTDELIRRWKNRRPNPSRNSKRVELSEF